MDNFIKNEINNLLNNNADPAVSIYLPMARAGEDTQKNPIRYKNARKKLENMMQEGGYNKEQLAAVSGQLESVVDGFDFFQDQLDGLAIFASADFLRLLKLPHRFEESVSVGDTFELRPLLQAYQNGFDFYLLALSREHSRLYRASKFNMVEIELGDDVPVSYEEAMKYDEPEDQLQHQSLSRAEGGRTTIFHGHSESEQENKNLRRFFHRLSAGVRDAVADHELPFLLVGLDYLQPIYRQVSGLTGLLDAGLDKNPDDMSADELHKQAWQVITGMVKSEVEKAVEKYRNGFSAGKSSDEIKMIPLASAYGKVDTLLVQKQSQLWGEVDVDGHKMEINEDGQTELLNFSVTQTLLNGGEVFVFDEDEMPAQDAQALAVLRY